MPRVRHRLVQVLPQAPRAVLAAATAAFALAVAAPAPDAQAQDMKILSAHVPPYAMDEDDMPNGFVADIVQELAQRVGQSDEIHFSSWSRVRDELESEPNRLLAPLVRTPEREDTASWVVPVFEDRMVVLSYGDGAQEMTLDDAEQAGFIGVQQNTVMHEMLEERGIENLDVDGDQEALARKLAAGRLASWVSLESMALFAMQLEGIDPSKIVYGEVLGTLDVYIAGSSSLSDGDLAPWREAFEEIKADGTYDAILADYGF